MISFNQDYSDIKKQLGYVEENISSCQNVEEYMILLRDYLSLSYIYSLCTGEGDNNFINEEIKEFVSKGNPMYDRKASNMIHKAKKNFYQSYLHHKEFHHDILEASYYDMMDILSDFSKSSFYREIKGKNFSPFKEKPEEILVAFFQEEDVVLQDIFSDLQKQNHLYACNQLYPGRACCVQSYSASDFFLFFRENLGMIDQLSSIVHEIGHIRDYIDIKQRGELLFYDDQSLYTETLSVGYEQRFLQFLIENDIHKEEAISELYHFYKDYATYFSSFLNLFGKECGYDKNSDELYEDLSYSYGVLIGNSIMTSEDQKNQFLSFRQELFDSEKLMAIGLTPEVVSKNMVKTMKQYLKVM